MFGPALAALILVTTAPAQTTTGTSTPPLDPHRLELGVVPGVALDSALGLGLANLLNLARLDPELAPYAWRLNALTQIFLSKNDAGKIAPTYQLYRFAYDAPRFLVPGVRLTAELSFSRLINSGYYGLGNASMATGPADRARYFEYDRITPLARVVTRVDTGQEVELFAGGLFAMNWINVFDGSRLQQDLQRGVNLVGVSRHARLEGLVGILREDRDDEIDPTHGGFHELSLRVGQLFETPATYGGLNLTLRQFVPVWQPYLVLAARFMTDLLFGDAPVYELARYGGLQPGNGPAGPLAIRGPRAQRYHGKIKVFANLELRARLLRFRLFGLPTLVGLVAFVDTGRVWTEWRARPELDGRGLGLKIAAGGGFRYRWGSAFVVRGDLGWSPDGVLFSVDAGHVF